MIAARGRADGTLTSLRIASGLTPWSTVLIEKLVVAQQHSHLFMEAEVLLLCSKPPATWGNAWFFIIRKFICGDVVWFSPSYKLEDSLMSAFRDCLFNMCSYPPCLMPVSCILGRTMWRWQGIQMTWTFTSIFTSCKHKTTDPRLMNWADATVCWDTNYSHSIPLSIYKLHRTMC
jgi:hypothetical protein